jgi:hypothetical protein
VQALPTDVRAAATAQVSGLLAPGGTLLVGAFAADTDEPHPGPPWPLTRAHVDAFASDGVKLESLERTRAGGRWWGIFTR